VVSLYAVVTCLRGLQHRVAEPAAEKHWRPWSS
jgi:hypothetical protein